MKDGDDFGKEGPAVKEEESESISERIIQRLIDLNKWVLLLIVIILSEIFTSIMSVILKGEVTYDYLITGGVVSLIVGGALIYFLLEIKEARLYNISLQAEIFERNKVEKALQESEERYRRLVELSPEAIAVHSGGKVVYINKAGVKLVGAKSPDEVVGTPMLDFVHPDYHELVMQRAQQTQEEGKEAGLIEEKFIRLDGEVIDVEVVAIPTTHKDKPATQVIVRDITERRQAEKAIEESERFLSSTFMSIQDGISILDRDMNIVRVNPMMLYWYPHSMPLIGRKCYEAYHGRSERCEACPSHHTLETGEAADEIVPLRGADGNIKGWLDLHSFPLVDAETGATEGVIEYVRDITAQKEAEEELNLERQQLISIFDSINEIISVLRKVPV